jgi:hypothetical protein
LVGSRNYTAVRPGEGGRGARDGARGKSGLSLVDGLLQAMAAPGLADAASGYADGFSSIAIDAPTLEEQGERVICDPPAVTSQAQERIPLVDCLPDTARSPKAIDFLAAIIAWEGPEPIPPLGEFLTGLGGLPGALGGRWGGSIVASCRHRDVSFYTDRPAQKRTLQFKSDKSAKLRSIQSINERPRDG